MSTQTLKNTTLRLYGEKYGKLTVIGIVGRFGKKKNLKVKCVCECGNEREAWYNNLKSLGSPHSCKSCALSKNRKRSSHGKSNHSNSTRYYPSYNCWQKLKDRCLNINSVFYPEYGGSGVTICAEWRDSFLSFDNWYKQQEKAPYWTLQLHDGHYEFGPGKCGFVSRKKAYKREKQYKIRNGHLVYNNKSLPVNKWAIVKKLNPHSLRFYYYRYYDGTNGAEILARAKPD